MVRINLSGDIEGLLEGFEQIRGDLGLENTSDGIPVAVKKGTCLKVSLQDNRAEIEYTEPVQFFRALSLLVLNLKKGSNSFSITEEPGFQKNGIMFDCSRNAVLTVDTLKFFIRKMALMGLNLGMMYTEDTYEVLEYPYFGYMRGRYTYAELKEADDYAAVFGIELVPCIQTLAHLNRALHWPYMDGLKDTEEVLLVGEESTYEFIENILKAATAPYRSNRIHIGMDEAMDLGLGRYLRNNGYHPSSEIMAYHLNRVREILKKLGLKAMMWSDMYFRVASPDHLYYDLRYPVTQDMIDSAPDDISLVYWDYYNSKESTITGMLEQHKRFKADTYFAGGIWTWMGPAADYGITLETTVPALKLCRKYGIKEVFATAWGDNGAEANLLTILYGLQLYAELGYTGEYKPDELAERFKITTGADAESFTDMTLFNVIPGLEPMFEMSPNIAKFMLYQDPLMPLIEADVKGFDLESHYASIEEKFKKHASDSKDFKLLFDFYTCLAKVLKLKCGWHQRAADCVRNKDYEQAKKLTGSVPEIISAVHELKQLWFRLWSSTNKPYGFEIIDQRLGGIISRLETAQIKMQQFANKETDDIPELSSEKLRYASNESGKINGYRNWTDLISACKI